MIIFFLQGKLDDYNARKIKGESLNQDQLVGKPLFYFSVVHFVISFDINSVFESI